MSGIGNENMDGRIRELFSEMELYRQAVNDAKDALASAEIELDEMLEAAYERNPE